ncbi:hypothetical protein EVC20_016 [Rhizobium phage RHph_Y2_17_1]|nr:hypothetical protein EVC19_016 [Rhizobium phage RHph_Y2_11]QIG75755.1 hypothetical protein EVC20_016 [Rhizobium phage RHph_Y2_17_1]
MEKFFFFVCMAIGGSLLWGYLDAFETHLVSKPSITASVIYDGWIFYDTMDDMQPYSQDQLFLEVHWRQPADMKIASIHLAGKVTDKGTEVSSFDAPCKRAGTTWLADTDRFLNAMSHLPDLVCFIKLDGFMPRDYVGSEDVIAESTAKLRRLKEMTISYSTVDVRAARPPLRYVSWINEKVAQVTKWVQYPFERGT